MSDYTSRMYLPHQTAMEEAMEDARTYWDMLKAAEKREERLREQLVSATAESLWSEVAMESLRNTARTILDAGDYDALLTGPRDWWHTTAAEKAPWEEKARALLALQRG